MTLIGPSGAQTATTAVPDAFSQTNPLPTLRHLVSTGRVGTAPDQGIFLPIQRVAPECVHTLRAYNANRVYAQCGHAAAVVELNGDETHCVGPASRDQWVLKVVHRLRLGKGF